MQITTTLSDKALDFLDDMPELAKHLKAQSEKGNFPAAFTPSIVEVNFGGLTYIRYEYGKLAYARPYAEGYAPTFWEVCFDEEETALFVFGREVLLDRTGDMAQLDSLLDQCMFLKEPRSALA